MPGFVSAVSFRLTPSDSADTVIDSVEVRFVSIENWSDNILVVELQDDPAFSDELSSLMDQLEAKETLDVVLSLASVNHLNSSNIAKLLKLRKKIINNRRRLVLCGINTTVWGLFLVTGLDKVFEFTDNVANALASVQIAAG